MYYVKINEPNKFFTIRGKQIRSPFSIHIQNNELKRIQSTIKIYGIIDYEIVLENDNHKQTIIHKSSNIKKEIIKIEEKIEEKIENFNLTSIQAIAVNNNPRFQRPKKSDENKLKDQTQIEDIKIEELSYKTSSILENLFKTYEL